MLLGAVLLGLVNPVTAQSLNALMGQSAGLYAGANQYVEEFKKTQCGYALMSNVASSDEVIGNEFLPGFKPSLRSEVFTLMKITLSSQQAEAPSVVQESIAEMHWKTGPRTACGKVAAGFEIVFDRAKRGCQETRSKRGRR